MSQELLKRALDALNKELMGTKAISLSEEIETYLAQPDEPVATVSGGTVIWIQPQAGRLKDRQPLYTSPPDQSARIAELAADGVRLMETITELRSNLAALQAKREPLNYGQILDALKSTMGDKAPLSLMLYDLEFCRAIEAAHGIGGE